MKKEIKKKTLNAKIKKVTTVKEKKNYFEIGFISISIFLFIVLILLIYFFKSSLFLAKDQVSQEFVSNYHSNIIKDGVDPFVATKGLSSEGIITPRDNNQDPAMGPIEAKIKIFYFSDMSCTFCFSQEEIIKKVYDKFSEDVRIIWKDYPELNALDDFSYQAARAIRCANDQGKFWDYKKMLHEDEKEYTSLGVQLFYNVANNVKLNISNFETCLKGDKTDREILQNVIEAQNLGVMGIPYIYINDFDMIGDFSEQELESIIENELAK